MRLQCFAIGFVAYLVSFGTIAAFGQEFAIDIDQSQNLVDECSDKCGDFLVEACERLHNLDPLKNSRILGRVKCSTRKRSRPNLQVNTDDEPLEVQATKEMQNSRPLRQALKYLELRDETFGKAIDALSASIDKQRNTPAAVKKPSLLKRLGIGKKNSQEVTPEPQQEQQNESELEKRLDDVVNRCGLNIDISKERLNEKIKANRSNSGDIRTGPTLFTPMTEGLRDKKNVLRDAIQSVKNGMNKVKNGFRKPDCNPNQEEDRLAASPITSILTQLMLDAAERGNLSAPQRACLAVCIASNAIDYDESLPHGLWKSFVNRSEQTLNSGKGICFDSAAITKKLFQALNPKELDQDKKFDFRMRSNLPHAFLEVSFPELEGGKWLGAETTSGVSNRSTRFGKDTANNHFARMRGECFWTDYDKQGKVGELRRTLFSPTRKQNNPPSQTQEIKTNPYYQKDSGLSGETGF